MHTTTRMLRSMSDEPLATAIPSRLADRASTIARGLSLLAEARDYAAFLHREIWDFAVELASLQAVGLTNSEIRCLVCMGYVKHNRERVDSTTDGTRRFCQEGLLTFCSESCFVLVEEGAAAFETWISRADATPAPNGQDLPTDAAMPTRPLTPIWDGERQELRVGMRLVKQFKLPSPNQEIILSCFQEEGWPARIDDPLPPVADILPKRRLHDTIKSLNRSQKCQLIRFSGDGSGEGVRWELRSPESFVQRLA